MSVLSVIETILIKISLLSDKTEADKEYKRSVMGKIAEWIEWQQIVQASITAAITVGIINDMVTVRMSYYYFSEGFHKKMIEGNYLSKFLAYFPENYTIWAIVWGCFATWWLGLALGIFLVLICRLGNFKKLGIRDIYSYLIATVSLISILVFVSGYSSYKQYCKLDIKAILNEFNRYNYSLDSMIKYLNVRTLYRSVYCV
jgi:hypothetical protein